jgi:hypothetical protein
MLHSMIRHEVSDKATCRSMKVSKSFPLVSAYHDIIGLAQLKAGLGLGRTQNVQSANSSLLIISIRLRVSSTATKVCSVILAKVP